MDPHGRANPGGADVNSWDVGPSTTQKRGTMTKMPARQKRAVLDALEIYRAAMRDAYLELKDLIEAATALEKEK